MKYILPMLPMILLYSVSGCALSDAKLDVRYDQDKIVPGPLSKVKPVIIQVTKFEDKRSKTEQIGYKRNLFGWATADVLTNEPVVDIVRNAVVATFEKNGHIVSDEQPNIVCSGDVETFWFETQVNFWTEEFMGTIDIILTIKDPSTNSNVFSKRYVGHKNAEMMYGYHKEMAQVMNSTLKDVMSQIETDPELIDIIKHYSGP